MKRIFAKPRTAFISYSAFDRADAFVIKKLLEAQGLEVWLDFFDVETSANLRQELAKRVKQSELFCLLLSPMAVESKWVSGEIKTALAAAKRGLRILPVILRPCRIPPLLDNIVGFDASEGLVKEAVSLRLVRAVCGESAVKETVVLDAATRLLLENKQKVRRAEEELPRVEAEIAESAAQPFRRISISIRPETLPEDSTVILELQLQLDRLFHGTMSFFIARYREGKTWPEELEFVEPPFDEFFLRDRPRLDVRFRWLDRVVEPDLEVDGTDLHDLPATFNMELDGAEFKPKGALNLPQTFEIPSLNKLQDQGSRFRLIAHTARMKSATEVAADTDIDIRLLAAAGNTTMCLYASRTPREQRVVLQSEFLLHVEHDIRRVAILHHYLPDLRNDRRQEIVAALEKGEFESNDQRRLAARLRYSEAVLARFRTLHRDAYLKFEEAAELLRPLVMEGVPATEDAALMYMSCRAVVETWLQQDRLPQAGEVAEVLGAVAQTIRDSDTSNPDFQRMWADAVLLISGIHAKLNDQRAAVELAEHVGVLARLYSELPSAERRKAYGKALIGGLQSAEAWGIEDAIPVTNWRALLASEVGENVAAKVTVPRSSMQLPTWLAKSNPKGWPTTPIASETLRYALRIPKSWNPEPEARATAMEVEHIYYGKRQAEWLIVTFMDKANGSSDIANWVEARLAITGFPVLINRNTLPKLVRCTNLGKVPALAKKLGADDAHAYGGLANYQESRRDVLGRFYIVMLRRRNFAWKVALSFETACFDGIDEELVNSQDHVRAGAILGELRVGDVR